MYKTGDEVYIRQGYGYTDHTDGIERFRRADHEVHGFITAIGARQQVFVTLDDGHSIVTGAHCIRPAQEIKPNG